MLLLLVSLAWLEGNAVAAYGLPVFLAPLAGLLSLWRVRSRGPAFRGLICLILVCIALAGFWSHRARRPEAGPDDISHYVDVGPTRVRGIVDGDPDLHGNMVVLHMDVLSVLDDRGLHVGTGTVLLRLSAAVPYVDGDLIEVRGKPITPPQAADFDYRAYLAQHGIYAEIDYGQSRLLDRGRSPWPRHAVALLRAKLDQGLTSVLPEPEASLGAGMLLGTRHVQEPSLVTALDTTDAAMIAIATGYNVTIVGLFVLSAFAPLVGRRRAAAFGLIAIAGYAVLLGAYPSVLRAAVMSGMVLLAVLAGRPSGAGRALIIACAAMVAIDPEAMRSLAFPLSLAATAGVVWLSEPIAGWIGRVLGQHRELPGARGWRRSVSQSLGVTFAAMGASMPVVAAASHALSPSSLPANTLLFPLVPPIMLACTATAIAGALLRPMALVFAPAAYALLSIMTDIVRMCAALPAASINVPWFGGVEAAAASALMVALVMLLRMDALARVRRFANRAFKVHDPAMAGGPPISTGEGPARAWVGVEFERRIGAPSIAVALMIGVAIGAGGYRLLRRDSKDLRVTYLDVGSGSAILLEASGRRVLVDSGPAGDATVAALDRRLPPWMRSLNLVVLADAGSSNSDGLHAVLERFRVGGVLDARSMDDGPGGGASSVRAAYGVRPGQDVKMIPVAGNTVLRVGGAMVNVVAATAARSGRPAEAASVSVAIGRRRFVLAGDAASALAGDVRSLGPANSSLPPVLPRVEVLQAGPARSEEAALASVPVDLRRALVYRTMENGDIAIETDGSNLQVRVQKGSRLGFFGGSR